MRKILTGFLGIVVFMCFVVLGSDNETTSTSDFIMEKVISFGVLLLSCAGIGVLAKETTGSPGGSRRQESRLNR